MVPPRFFFTTTVLAISISLVAGCAAGARPVITNAPAPVCVGNPSTDIKVYAASALSVRPALRESPPPGFPEVIVGDGLERRVVLQFVVDAAGVVDTSTITVEESNDFRLNKYLIAMVGASSYWPGCLGDTAVASRVVVVSTFRAEQTILVPRSQARPRE